MASACTAASVRCGSILGSASKRGVAPFALPRFSGLRVAFPLRLPVATFPVPGPATRKVNGRTLSVVSSALPVLTFEGEKAGEVELNLRTARPKTAKAVVHRGVVTELQNKRKGTASTLTRSQVRGGGRKPYKQKGTGRARIGSLRTPLRPGGGVVFGPKPRDWRIKINKKEKRLAFSTALQSASPDLVVLEDFDDKFEAPRTKNFVAAMQRWGADPKTDHVLLFTLKLSTNAHLSSRNIPNLKVMTPNNVNVYDVLRADKIYVTKSGLGYLEQMYGDDIIEELIEETEEGEAEEAEAGSEDGAGSELQAE